jgi:two-component system, NarL family, response regulator NreC
VTTIVLADDHHVVRHGLRALLEREQDFSIVGEAADGREVIEVVLRLRPDVLILDLVMPKLQGLEVTQLLTTQTPATRIIVLSMHASEGYVLEALRKGAVAYVLKEATSTELVTAVREVVSGRRYLSPPLSERAISAYVQKTATNALDVYETLTAREREVLRLAAEGYTSTRIAAALSISPRTAETHRANLMRKLALRTQADLIRYALRRDTPLDPPREGASDTA